MLLDLKVKSNLVKKQNKLRREEQLIYDKASVVRSWLKKKKENNYMKRAHVRNRQNLYLL